MTTTNDATTTAEKATDLLTAVEIANFMGVSPKSLRRFIRNQDAACGKGNRYGFTADEAKALIRDFNNRPVRTTAETRSADEVAALLA